MFLFDVVRDFDICVNELLKDRPEILRFIQNHERRQVILNNVCHQVQVYERKYKNRLDLRTKRKIIAASAQIFINTAIKQREQSNWSEAKQIGEQRKVWEKKELQEEMSKILKEVDDDGQTRPKASGN